MPELAGCLSEDSTQHLNQAIAIFHDPTLAPPHTHSCAHIHADSAPDCYGPADCYSTTNAATNGDAEAPPNGNASGSYPDRPVT